MLVYRAMARLPGCRYRIIRPDVLCTDVQFGCLLNFCAYKESLGRERGEWRGDDPSGGAGLTDA